MSATMMARRQPGLVDAIHQRAGAAQREVAGAKRWASLMGRSERYVRMEIAGERPSVWARAAELVRMVADAGLSAWPLIVNLEVEALAALMARNLSALRATVAQLMREETAAQGQLDMVQIGFDPYTATVDQWREIEERAARHATRLKDLAAHAREIRRQLEAQS